MTDPSLNQEEVWDDADLVDSWNEAFAEYKKYHSIAAKGGKVSPAPAMDKKGLTNGDNPSIPTGSMEQTQNEAADSDEYAPSVGQASKSGQSAGAGTFVAPAAPPIPQALAANMQDENLKNLMMSWYYAGYYTGLYEGKQQGYASGLQEQRQPG